MHGGMASLPQLGEFISSYQPDVVFLQEVDINTQRLDAPDQNDKHFIAELGYYTKMFTAFGKSISFSGGYYGLGLLSRYPIISMKRVLLPMLEPEREQRSLLIAEIELDNGQSVCVACTHLDLKPAERIAQVEYLNKVLKETGLPVLVAGDFNATPADKEIKYGMGEWIRAMEDNAYTYPHDKPQEKIDYIFAYPHYAWQVHSAIVPNVQMSDHRAIVAEFELLTQ